MSRLIPPLNPLHVFEVVARLGSFTRAASELNVTQSAVSRQISALEGYLQVQLFHRERHGVQLTRTGEAYRAEIMPAFETIARATAGLLDTGKHQPISLRVYPTFAIKWLIPRLPRFNAEFPAIDVKVNTGTRPVAFSKEAIDLAIQLAPTDPAPLNGCHLFSDVIQPVCSPSLLNGCNSPQTIEDIVHHRRLLSHYRRRDWRDWLAAVGHADLKTPEMEFSSSMLTYQAAAEGLGIAIGQLRFLDHDFADGTLVPLFGRPIERKLAYYVFWPANREPNRKVRTFISWLEREASVERKKPLVDGKARQRAPVSRQTG